MCIRDRKGREIPIRYHRPLDRRGLNVFETTKAPGASCAFRYRFAVDVLKPNPIACN